MLQDWDRICRKTSSTSICEHVFDEVDEFVPAPVFRNNIPRLKNPKMSSFDERFLSFRKWPKQIKQTPEEMAKSGWFYSGESDRCQTFCCGVVAYHWDRNDDPWKEHAKHRPKCKLPVIHKYRQAMKKDPFDGGKNFEGKLVFGSYL